MGSTGREAAGKAGRGGEHVGREAEEASGLLELGKIPREMRSNSGVYKKRER